MKLFEGDRHILSLVLSDAAGTPNPSAWLQGVPFDVAVAAAEGESCSIEICEALRIAIAQWQDPASRRRLENEEEEEDEDEDDEEDEE